MVISYPWTGRDWNQAVVISGRAAMPGLIGGSGFNWKSIAGTMGYVRPGMSGLGRRGRRIVGRRIIRMTNGFRGLGQDDGGYTTTDPSSGFTTINITGNVGSDTGTSLPVTTSTVSTAGCAPGSFVVDAAGNCFDPSNSNNILLGGSTSTAPPATPSSILQSLIGAGSQIANYELNPSLQKQTYITLPNGTVIASNAASLSAAGITATSGTLTSSSLMPLLLLGGAAVVFMMMARR